MLTVIRISFRSREKSNCGHLAVMKIQIICKLPSLQDAYFLSVFYGEGIVGSTGTTNTNKLVVFSWNLLSFKSNCQAVQKKHTPFLHCCYYYLIKDTEYLTL